MGIPNDSVEYPLLLPRSGPSMHTVIKVQQQCMHLIIRMTSAQEQGRARLHVEHKALQGEAKDRRDAVQPDLACSVHLALAEGTVVLVIALQVLSA